MEESGETRTSFQEGGQMRLLMSIVWWGKKPIVLGKNAAMKLMLAKAKGKL
jgi:hypothetical protein